MVTGCLYLPLPNERVRGFIKSKHIEQERTDRVTTHHGVPHHDTLSKRYKNKHCNDQGNKITDVTMGNGDLKALLGRYI